MNNQKISLLLLTKNESENVKKNLLWLNDCPSINEVIVVDDNSTDDTIKILESLKPKHCKIKIFKRDLSSDFSSQRQFGLEQSTNNLILWLDADEQPSTELVNWLGNIDVSQYENFNFAFCRYDIFLGQELKHGETANQHFLRLFDKRHGQFKGLVHETWVSSKPISKLNLAIIHNSHKTLESFLLKINFYTDLRAAELNQQQVHTNLLEIIFYPLAKFFYGYFIQLGFLDGTPGIILALGMSLHSFLVRSKLWHLQNP